MISTGELKKGVTIELEGQLYTILDYQHLKLGRGSAQVRIKLRDVRGGHTIERTFQAGERFPRARLDRHAMQYLYGEGDLHYFMDTENFEQITLSTIQLGDSFRYIKDGQTVEVLSYQSDPIGVELPAAVELKVKETGPGFKGDTSSSGTKPATLETGLTLQVPFFINVGDVVKIDTRTGAYLGKG